MLAILNTVCTPVMLTVTGLILSRGIRIHRIISPRRFWRTLSDIPENSHTTPGKAVSMALAGTLGVGNITGVSAAILQGGVGAVFWMCFGALLSMAVKYGEVALAVRYRKQHDDGTYYGGMMYVLRDGWMRGHLRSRAFPVALGGLFAVFCIANALVTGTLVQSHAAAAVLPPDRYDLAGLLLLLATVFALLYGIDRVSDFTMLLIPAMTGIYILLSLWIILQNLSIIPSILWNILQEAFDIRALGGGITGTICACGMTNALRFGFTRGIFSNEAGCGTSPTAHATADTKSPFHQGCYGIFEVFCDTLVLCTMTALVICIADRRYDILSMGGDDLTLVAYAAFGGKWIYALLSGMVILFAYATILAQLYYGTTALGYFTKRKSAQYGYFLLTLAAISAGTRLDTTPIWMLADALIGIMTCWTTAVLLTMRKEIYETVPKWDM